MQTGRKQIFRLFLISCGLCLGIAGCDDDYRIRGDFYYLNSSGYNVVIRRYNFVTDTTVVALPEIKIKPKTEYKARVESVGPEDVSCEDFPLAIKCDSLSISYSNKIVSSFTPADTTSNNPLLLRNYLIQKVAQNTCLFQFTID
jgi:hypothetical protein